LACCQFDQNALEIYLNAPPTKDFKIGLEIAGLYLFYLYCIDFACLAVALYVCIFIKEILLYLNMLKLLDEKKKKMNNVAISISNNSALVTCVIRINKLVEHMSWTISI